MKTQQISNVAALLMAAASMHATLAWGGEVGQSCPAKTFAEFSELYVNSAEIQQKHTAVPLKKSRLDMAGPGEPKPIKTVVGKAELKFPVFPSPEERRRQGWTVSTKDRDGVIQLSKPDTGMQVNYLFKKGRCWELVAIDDQST